MNLAKLTERKFMVPGSANLLALVNEAGNLGFSFKLMVLFVGASLAYAAIEACVDCARMRCGTQPRVTVTSLAATTIPPTA